MLSLLGYSWIPDPFIQNTLGWVAVFAVLGLFLSPIKDIWGEGGVFKNKSTASLATGIPYFASFFNCFLWSVYAFGDLPRLLQPLVINLIGAALHLSFMSCFWYYASDKKESSTAFISGAAVSAVCAVMSMQAGNVAIFGKAAAFVNVIMYYSPLAAVGEVLRTKSVKTWPLIPLIMTFIGSSLWFSYGLYILEWPCIIPNALGIIFGITQLATYAYVSKIEAANQAEAGGLEAGASKEDPPPSGTAAAALPPRSSLRSPPPQTPTFGISQNQIKRSGFSIGLAPRHRAAGSHSAMVRSSRQNMNKAGQNASALSGLRSAGLVRI